MGTWNIKDDAYKTAMMWNCFYKAKVSNKKHFYF